MNNLDSHLPPPLDAECVSLSGRAGKLMAYVAGDGPPLLLVHSINAAGSAAEVRPLHDHYRRTRTVVSIDLPGFGLSDRSDRPYTPRLMTDAVLDLIDFTRGRFAAAPIDVLGVSLGCEFVARAAVERPEAFRTVALVSPTGLGGKRDLRNEPGSTLRIPGMLPLLRGPGWGRGLFRLLTRPGVIRYFLERTWGSKNIDEALWRYDVLVTRAPGAHHAPLHFLSGGLFSGDIHNVYERVVAPVWLVHGVRGDFTDYDGFQRLRLADQWRRKVFQTGALPHFEVPGPFVTAYDDFLRAHRAAG